MSLTHAILTSLLEKACTGAELARRFDKSLGHFWQATHQQIYRELAGMEQAGLVRGRGLPSTRGRQRHFEVLAAGQAALVQWCAQEGEPRPIRDALLVRLRAAAVLGTAEAAAAVLAQMRAHRILHARTLEGYGLMMARDFPAAGARTRSQELQAAVLQAGMAYERSWLAWCDDALAGVAGAAPPGSAEA